MCRATRYTAHGAPLHAGYCHCRSCRHHSGAAVAAMLVFAAKNVAIAGPHALYRSSPGVTRGFCSTCGTSLSWSARGLVSLHIGSLDEPDAHAPTLHWRWEERPGWLDEACTLPQEVMTGPDETP